MVIFNCSKKWEVNWYLLVNTLIVNRLIRLIVYRLIVNRLIVNRLIENRLIVNWYLLINWLPIVRIFNYLSTYRIELLEWKLRENENRWALIVAKNWYFHSEGDLCEPSILLNYIFGDVDRILKSQKHWNVFLPWPRLLSEW